jgi:hypothetical protein
MTDFGWSYPAGVNELPDDVLEYCSYCLEKDTKWDKDWQEETHVIYDLVFCSLSCKDLWEEQKDKYDLLRHLLFEWEETVKNEPTIESLFMDAPDGDFKWDDEFGTDPRPWSCDCTQGWHLSTTYINMGRKNGKRYIEMLIDAYSDGDAQPSYGWEEGEDPEEILYVLRTESSEYFKQWTRYWLDAYFTGRDILNQFIVEPKTPGGFRDACLDAAEDELKFLYMG